MRQGRGCLIVALLVIGLLAFLVIYGAPRVGGAFSDDLSEEVLEDLRDEAPGEPLPPS